MRNGSLSRCSKTRGVRARRNFSPPPVTILGAVRRATSASCSRSVRLIGHTDEKPAGCLAFPNRERNSVLAPNWYFEKIARHSAHLKKHVLKKASSSLMCTSVRDLFSRQLRGCG